MSETGTSQPDWQPVEPPVLPSAQVTVTRLLVEPRQVEVTLVGRTLAIRTNLGATLAVDVEDISAITVNETPPGAMPREAVGQLILGVLLLPLFGLGIIFILMAVRSMGQNKTGKLVVTFNGPKFTMFAKGIEVVDSAQQAGMKHLLSCVYVAKGQPMPNFAPLTKGFAQDWKDSTSQLKLKLAGK